MKRRCDECEWSRTKTDADLNMKRFCMYDIPKVQVIPHPRGMAQVTSYPEVEDNAFCHLFLRREFEDDKVKDSGEGSVPSIIVS